MFNSTLGRLAAGHDLSRDEMAAALDEIMRGEVPEGQIGLLLTLLHEKGETVDEVAGAAAALRKHMTPIRTRRRGVIDTCGTGGDGSDTFNISTAAALVTAAAGVPVAKHGNRKITSRTGSADVLAALGVNIDADVATVTSCLDELGICFCFAPLLHGAMKNVAAVRRKLGFPTLFNLLGPLTNPAGAEYQLLGVGRAEIRPLLAQALQLLGTTRALVVRGDDGLDEVTLRGATQVSEATPAGVREFTWTPHDFDLAQYDLAAIAVEGPEQSADMIGSVLTGRSGVARDIVLVNAAAALWTAGKASSLPEGVSQAAAAIDSGSARDLLDRLVDRSRRSC
jgi:anthranilate phosphoribosyltransferase